MRANRVSALLACAGIVGALAACSAVLGITEFTSGDAGPRDATSPADAQGLADGGSIACADAASGAMGAIGCACAQAGQLACNGNAQAQTLICSGGVWSLRSTCASGLNCDSRLSAAQGTCAPIDSVCTNAMPGQAVCSTPTTVVQCGPDLVSETPVSDCTNQACVGGACTGVCTPSATQCAGNSIETCGTDGQWHMTSTCSEACSDGGCGSFNSCVGRAAGAGFDCGGPGGDAGSSDCCGSFEAPGGTFYRGYDDVSAGFTSKASPATVSGFRLDAYEVTVGRFRAFVNAVANGWRPGAGDGKHTQLNGGSGLANVGQADAGAFENGWDASWTSNLASSVAGWSTALGCQSAQGAANWTASPGGNEHQPINCITWYEAYAFCIWDGGFLPSEAEWNYVASGGSEQRVYPWSSPAMSTTIDCAHANYSPMGMSPCSATGTTNVGSDSPAGDSKWGQADLGGNVWEWTLDSYAPPPYVTPCTDCSNVEPPLSSRVTRGGSYNVVAFSLLTSYRTPQAVATRDTSVGVRCARRP